MDQSQVERLLKIIPKATLMPVRDKIPVMKGWPDQEPGTINLDPNLDVGLITGAVSGCFVVDCDSIDAAGAFVGMYPHQSTLTVRTRRGLHFYFKHPGVPIPNSVSKLLPKVDVRGERGYVVAPGSENRTIEIDLPLADPPAGLVEAILAESRVEGGYPPTPIDHTHPEWMKRCVMAETYCLQAPPSIQGDGGSGALFAVALHLVRRLELPLDHAVLVIMQNFNPRCQPPWSEEEVRHKCEDARDKSMIPTGILPEWLGGDVRNPDPKEEAPAAGDQPEQPMGKLASIDFNTILQTLTTYPTWEGVLRYDVLQRRPTAVRPPIPLALQHGPFADSDVGEIRGWFEARGFKPSVDNIRMAVDTICARHPYNAFVEYLDSLPRPTTVVHLPRLHLDVLNSPDGAMASSVFTKQMVAAVRRMRAMRGPHEQSPRIDHRIVVILDGDQETGKTSLLRQLAGAEFYGSISGDVTEKDTMMLTIGKVFVEMEEMATARKADRDNLKAFCSRIEDEYRRPYARGVEKIVRSWVLFGTSNDLRLNDPTGSTRFVVIRVGKMCGKDALLAIRDTLWAEANALALDETFDTRLTDEERSLSRDRNEDYESDIFTERMRKALAGQYFITTEEAYDCTMMADAKKMPTPVEQGQVQDSLRRLRCKPERIAGKGKRVSGWVTPPEIRALPKSMATSGWLKDAHCNAIRERLETEHNLLHG